MAEALPKDIESKHPAYFNYSTPTLQSHPSNSNSTRFNTLKTDQDVKKIVLGM
jgi:hypothetical protein